MIAAASIKEFQEWLYQKGFRQEETKFMGEVLRMRKRATSPLSYCHDGDTLIGHNPRAIKMARRFARTQ